jgi:hypothetical protein
MTAARVMGGAAGTLRPCDATKVVAELLDGPGALGRCEASWRALWADTERPSCFTAPAYMRAWQATLGGDVETVMLVARRAGRLVGIMPLMRARVRRGPRGVPRHDFAPGDRALLGTGPLRPFALRQVSPVVSMPACLVGPAPLCRDADRGAVIVAMAPVLAALRSWDVLAIPVDAEREQDTWLGALTGAGLSPWVLPLGRRIGGIERVETFADRLARGGYKARQNVRRAQAAGHDAGLALAVHEGREAVAPLLADLAAVASASWKEAGRPGGRPGKDGLVVPYSGRQRRFVEALIGDAGREGGGGGDLVPVLALARLGVEPVAALLSLRHRDRLTALVTFRTGALPAASPGLLLMGLMMDWAAERGLAAFDLNATHEWTRHLVDEVRTQNLVACFSRGPKGRLMALISAATRRGQGGQAPRR